MGALMLFYFILLTWVAGDWHHPFQQFLTVKYWMSALFLGFGIQVGLFWFVRSNHRAQNTRRMTRVSAGVTTGTMIACCAHHITDIIPVLGLSAATVFLGQYQTYFLAIAVAFNVAGIIFMVTHFKKHNLFINAQPI